MEELNAFNLSIKISQVTYVPDELPAKFLEKLYKTSRVFIFQINLSKDPDILWSVNIHSVIFTQSSPEIKESFSHISDREVQLSIPWDTYVGENSEERSRHFSINHVSTILQIPTPTSKK